MAARWGVLLMGTSVHVLGGQTGTPFKSEGWPLFRGWYRRGWVVAGAAEGLGGWVQPPSHAATEAAHGEQLWWARVPPWSERGHFQSLLPPLPQLLTRIRLHHPTSHAPASLFCSSRAKFSVPRVCAENTHF